MEDLYADPRPDLAADSKLWIRLFSLVPQIVHQDKRLSLLKRLWAYRQLGAVINIRSDGVKIAPHPDGAWESQQDFDAMAKKLLLPYAIEIKLLLRKVVEDEQTV